MNRSPFEMLLNKKMTRKEFIFHLGFLVMALTGIAGMLDILSDPNWTKTFSFNETSFGSGPYGGTTKKTRRRS
jgi:hypothetical protein